MIDEKIKTKEAELIIRFLAEKENYGKKFTANFISKALDNISYRKASELLPLFSIKFQNIFGYEQVMQIEYFWIKIDKESFVKWFREWFKKDY